MLAQNKLDTLSPLVDMNTHSLLHSYRVLVTTRFKGHDSVASNTRVHAVNRRRFLEHVASAAAAASMGACRDKTATVYTPQTQWNGNWGGTVPQQRFALLGPDATPDGILEVFLLGGLTPWETFYAAPSHGNPQRPSPYQGQQWWSFQNPPASLSVPEWYTNCVGSSSPLLTPWQTDSNGIEVFLGPFIESLRQRPDILSRMKVWVMRHDTEPHELSIPLAMSGHPLGNPRMASLGAHIQRYFSERNGTRTAPYAYTVYMNALQLAAAGKAASSVGLHRASSRPLEVALSAAPTLPLQLPRTTVAGYRDELDALLRHYQKTAANRLGRGKLPDLRSPGFDDYTFARSALENHQALTGLLTNELLSSDYIDLCLPQEVPDGPGSIVRDEVETGLRTATRLLTAHTDAARYVQFVDSGIYTDPVGQGYDAHGNHVVQSAPNIHHLVTQLVRQINEPGENDPTKLDLDRHFILLNTEFGRSPYPEVSPRNPHGGGTDHWPWGYVVVGFGGFIREQQAGLLGAIGENGIATEFITPAEHRAALLSAMGIWPFTEESFAVGDIRDVGTELDAAVFLREHILGYRV